ncbi:bifunctional 3,4-dihydroxy-2-butanone-4-phosphate synthase/GTP cyclohydrolase II [Thermotoga sp. KOL6]|uniref:bifunctional 3,4-dihydroxy-2-butanone-4-phosphate synthase/GTP cyclohydrolase II n=1 Tax=Thermotoga sp. KOL6 TaxID=126741 RepID=UPI000C776D54|nr:bifunctional 3,4-dihydroxy-2-butanone-4-phosphate synthase/GTP cyclohydrolase II [Thermotoga sp. KOL6]PLV60455.1 3,4-dihydroxy-2-butanone 4-phosphate synthase [Thermotoga sp. KOL6]
MEKLKEAFENKKPVILLDRERENEADFIFPARIITPEIVNLFVSYGKGLFCVTVDEEDLLKRGFPKLPSNYNANYFLSVDWGTGTGISTVERAETCRKVAEGRYFYEFRYPGHVTVIGGVGFQKRRGHTEASLEIAEMAGYTRHAVIVEILDDHGNSHNLEHVTYIANKLSIPMIEMKDVWIEFVSRKELITVKAEAFLPTSFGEFKIVSFENLLDGKEHFAIVKEPFVEPVHVRIHSECVTGDVLSSLRCDCGSQLESFLRHLSNQGGVLIYLRQEGRGIGLSNKVKAYRFQDEGMDTVEANKALGFSEDERDYAAAAQILRALGIKNVILHTNNPRKIQELERYGIEIAGTRNLYGRVTEYNKFYLLSKMVKLGHRLEDALREVFQ